MAWVEANPLILPSSVRVNVPVKLGSAFCPGATQDNTPEELLDKTYQITDESAEGKVQTTFDVTEAADLKPT